MIGYGNSYFISTILDSGSGGTPPVNTVAPVISGSTTLGSLLSCTTGTWTGAPTITYAYQWKRNGNNIIGANSSLYTIQVADSGAALTCQVTATNIVGSAAATSNTITANTFVAPTNTVAPVLSGTAQEGQTLTTSIGSWTGTPVINYTYQWKRNGSNIGSATNSTYTLVTADVGQSIKCTVTATNILGSASADSNTVIPIAAFTGLLDTYSGAEAAYSLRKLRSAYTGNAIRVRRSSDNTEQNIGFVNNVLDTSSLLTFVGAGNGFITTWYDQSGNANNATQTTAANQPQIVSTGAMITTNGKNSISFDGTNDSLNLTSIINVAASNYNSFVGKRDASGRRLMGLTGGQGGAVYLWALWIDNNYYLQAKATHYQGSNATDTTTNQLLLTGLNNAGTMSIFKNGNTITSAQNAITIGMTISTIGIYSGPAYAFCNLQEIVFYNSNQSTNRTGIETNINSFYSVY